MQTQPETAVQVLKSACKMPVPLGLWVPSKHRTEKDTGSKTGRRFLRLTHPSDTRRICWNTFRGLVARPIEWYALGSATAEVVIRTLINEQFQLEVFVALEISRGSQTEV